MICYIIPLGLDSSLCFQYVLEDVLYKDRRLQRLDIPVASDLSISLLQLSKQRLFSSKKEWLLSLVRQASPS